MSLASNMKISQWIYFYAVNGEYDGNGSVDGDFSLNGCACAANPSIWRIAWIKFNPFIKRSAEIWWPISRVNYLISIRIENVNELWLVWMGLSVCKWNWQPVIWIELSCIATQLLINQCSTDGAVTAVTTDRDRQIVNIANEMTFCCASLYRTSTSILSAKIESKA